MMKYSGLAIFSLCVLFITWSFMHANVATAVRGSVVIMRE